MKVKVNRIGIIDNGCDGSDSYYLVVDEDSNGSVEEVRNMFEEAHGNMAWGNQFCAGVSVVKQEHADNVYLVTVRHRFDN